MKSENFSDDIWFKSCWITEVAAVKNEPTKNALSIVKPISNTCGLNSKSFLKPLSVTKNVVGLQTDDADHVCQNSSAYVARVVGLQTDAVVVTETRFRIE